MGTSAIRASWGLRTMRTAIIEMGMMVARKVSGMPWATKS